MMIERVWFEQKNEKSPKDLRYNCILWLATHKQHTHTQTNTSKYRKPNRRRRRMNSLIRYRDEGKT